MTPNTRSAVVQGQTRVLDKAWWEQRAEDQVYRRTRNGVQGKDISYQATFFFSPLIVISGISAAFLQREEKRRTNQEVVCCSYHSVSFWIPATAHLRFDRTWKTSKARKSASQREQKSGTEGRACTSQAYKAIGTRLTRFPVPEEVDGSRVIAAFQVARGMIDVYQEC
jgi:hypothetical protein